MDSKKKPPTYEEYVGFVKKCLKPLLPNVSDTEIEKYLDSDESVETIKDDYDRDMAGYKDGKLTYRQITESGPAGVAYALDLMYEGPFDNA